MSFVFVFVIEHTFCFGFLLDIYLIYSIIRYAIAPPPHPHPLKTWFLSVQWFFFGFIVLFPTFSDILFLV